MKLLKRTLAMLLVLTMVLGMVPFAAFAEETTEGTEGTLPVPAHMATKPADGTVTGQPFNDAESVSRNYRIPGLVNHNGTLIATADVRYNAEKDGGGIDIVVSRSADNGKNWNYTFPAYLGDNGNEWVKSSSTMMDPLIISDGANNKLYLFYDMFPAGYSLRGEPDGNTTYAFWATGTGFDDQGRLRLGQTYNARDEASWNYYLENGQIKDSSGNAVAGYTVDEWFNVYQGDTYVSNLFFSSGSPYYAYPTSYVATQTSVDGGVTWSDPQLLPNIKHSGTTWQVLGPGSGLITQDGKIAFTVYNSDSSITLVYGDGSSWNTVKTSSAPNESSIVELSDGTIRAFAKNNGNTIRYVDFTKTDSGYTAGGAVDTGRPSQSWCMVSSMLYSKTLGGKDVILVTCPTSTASNNSRYNGKMHMFTVNDDADKTMNYVGAYEINGANDFFAYSDMAELPDGKIALLYEDGCQYYSGNNGVGYSHIKHITVDLEAELNVEFDVDYNVFVWNDDHANGSIRVPATAGVNHVHVQPKILDTMTVDYSAYDMVLCKDEEDGCAGFACTNVHTGTAIVELALTESLKAVDDVKGFVVEADGSITSVFDVENDGTYVTFEAPHFSVVGIAAMTKEEIAQKNAEEITLYVGETKTCIDKTGNYVDAENTSPDTNVASMVVEAVETVAGSLTIGEAVETVTEGQYVIYTYLNAYVANSPDGNYIDLSATETVWQIAVADAAAGTYYITDSQGRYLYVGNQTAGVTETQTAVKLVYGTSTDGPGESGFFIQNAAGSYNLNNSGGTDNAFGKTGASGSWSRWQLKPCTEVPAEYGTKITFTGEGVGNTEATVGGTVYKINVKERIVQDITLTAGETETFTIYGHAYSMDDVTTHPNGAYATLDSVVSTVPALVPVTAIESGKQYLIVNRETGDVLSDTVITVPGQHDDKTGLDSTEKASADSTELWTIAAVDGKHTVAQGDRYLTVAGFYANMSDTETKLTLEYTDSGWTIYDNTTYKALGHDGPGYYLSDNVGEGHTSGALGTSLASNTARYWDLYEVYPEGITTVTFTGVAEGKTTAIIGDVIYNIIVTPDEMNEVEVELHVGETKDYTIDGAAYTDADVTKAENADTVVTTNVAATSTDGEKYLGAENVTAITSGKTYVLYNKVARKLLNNEWADASVGGGGTDGLGLSSTKDNFQDKDCWKITAVEGVENGYYVQDLNNKYLTVASGKAGVSDSPVVISLAYDGTDWTIGENGEYLNDFGGKHSAAAGWSNINDVNAQWEIYEVNTTAAENTTVTFTGKAVGTTTVIIGNTQYNITVSYREVPVIAYIGTTVSVTPSGTITQDDIDAFNTAHSGKVSIALADGKLVFTGIAEEPEFTVILGNTRYRVMTTKFVENITLYPGLTRTFTIDGFNYDMDDVKPLPDSNSASLENISGTAAGSAREAVKVTKIESGKQYIFVNSRAAKTLTNTATGDLLTLAGTKESLEANAIWNVESTDGGYFVTDANGKYLTVGNGTAHAVTTAHTIALNFNGAAWTIGEASYYLNDYENLGNQASGYNNSTDAGSLWQIYEVVTVGASTEVTFKGVTAGTTTTAVVGHVTYNITVLAQEVRDITLYVGVTQNDFIDGYTYTDANVTEQPDNTYAYIHSATAENGGTKVVFSGVAEGTTDTATVGHVKYNITVKSLRSGGDLPDFNCVAAENTYSGTNLANKEVNSLRITAGAKFDLGVDVTGYESIAWTTADPAVATVDTTGRVTAVAVGTTLVTATVTKNGIKESISVHVTVVPSMVEGCNADQIATVVFYTEEVYKTDPFYTLFLSSENETGPVAEHTMVMTMEGQVIYLERPKIAAYAMVWTADPWDQHALTYMSAVNTAGQYYPLQSSDGVVGENKVGDTVYFKCTLEGHSTQGGCPNGSPYHNVGAAGTSAGASWQAALDELLEYNVHVGEGIWDEFGCDGIMLTSRGYNNPNPSVATAQSFISDKLPEVTKVVDGVLPVNRKFDYYRRYDPDTSPVVVATIGEQVYFKITVTLERPHAMQPGTSLGSNIYTDALLQDVMKQVDGTLVGVKDGFFYTKELDNEDNKWDGIVPEASKTQTQDLTTWLNNAWADGEEQRVLELYFLYTIQQSDLTRTDLGNQANLNYSYSSKYSTGVKAGGAVANAAVLITGKMLDPAVIDFGESIRGEIFADQLGNAVRGEANYGTVDIRGNLLTYTPNAILQNMDTVTLYDAGGKLINSLIVYPATTVYYEEDFLVKENSSWTLGGTNTIIGSNGFQTLEKLGATLYDTSGQYIETITDKKHPYGYDPMYQNNIGASGGTYAAATAVGATTSFTFTGTGFDIYANCTLATGYVAVTLEDANGKVVKMYTVNTAVKDASALAQGETHEDEYHLPIVSELGLPHGTYTVTVRKIVKDNKEVRLDGVRIYNTLEDPSNFTIDLEDAPLFFELRDYVLNAVEIDDSTSGKYGSLSQMAGQIYSGISTDGEAPVAVITNVGDLSVYGSAATAQELLDNGPKNELFLYPGQSLTFNVETSRMLQLGLKAPLAATNYSLQYVVGDNTTVVADNQALNSSVDMFYNLQNLPKVNIATSDKVTITSTSDSENTSQANGAAALVDRDKSTLYKFHDKQLTGEESIVLTYAAARIMDTMVITFEKVENETLNYAFTYSIWAYNADGTYDIIADHVTANRTNNNSQTYTFMAKAYPKVEIVMHSCKTGANGENNGWPAVAEFEIYGTERTPLAAPVTHTVTVENNGPSILSVTKLKISDDPNGKLAPLTVAEVEQILLASGYPADEEEETPDADPTVPMETQPVETQPVETQPVETQPVETKPAVTEPENAFGCTKDIDCVLSQFTDADANEWYHDGVHFCVAEGLMNGMGEGIFAPNDPTTRAQLVTMLYRLMGNPKAEGKTEPFTDVAEGEWYYDAIVWAYSENVVKGISETEFAPNANVTREQVATILHRFLVSPEGTGKLDSFSDAASVSDYAEDALVWAVGEGLINGVAQSNGTAKLDPAGNATRAQIATILYRYLENA